VTNSPGGLGRTGVQLEFTVKSPAYDPPYAEGLLYGRRRLDTAAGRPRHHGSRTVAIRRNPVDDSSGAVWAESPGLPAPSAS
jgi:hypothetical protein